ncbi:homocysteine S-methyltransferase family protein [Bacillus licheniformis]|nr:homocysteine S-methyltransferase family protein [Bacillus licheniformis]
MFEELNISKPEEIRRVHEAYVQAGADIIQTNTYGANFIKLSRYGLEDETNKSTKSRPPRPRRRRLRLCSRYARRNPDVQQNSYSLEDIKRSFREQLYLLLNEQPDGLLLETYYDLEEAREVLKIARKETELPII